MYDLLAELLIIFFEVICCKIFYEIFGEIRYKGWINVIQLIILECSVFIAARGLSDLFIVKQIVMATIYAMIMFWHINMSIKKSFVLALLHGSLTVE